jgi:ribosomal protein S8
MIQNNYIANYVAILNYAIKTKRIYCRIVYTKLGERLTSLLFKHGYILMYRILPQMTFSFIYIQLKKIHSFNPLFNVQLVSKPTNLIYWTVDRLIDECARSGVLTQYVLSTPKGLLLSNNAIAARLGGKVLFKIN